MSVVQQRKGKRKGGEGLGGRGRGMSEREGRRGREGRREWTSSSRA